RVAVLEDDKVAEVYLERPERRSIAGNIYLGVVDNVLPGMEAAFVEIGLEKNGFLYVDEIVGPELEGRKGARKIQDLIQRGKTIEAKAKDAKAPSLVYQEAELPLRVVRDLFTGDFERLLVDHDRTHKRIVGYLKKTSPHMAERVTRYKEREPLMEAFGVEQE